MFAVKINVVVIPKLLKGSHGGVGGVWSIFNVKVITDIEGYPRANISISQTGLHVPNTFP